MEGTKVEPLLDALHAATIAISAETRIDQVLQLIVDRVRPLVGARYAALGIVDSHGGIERFITSGMDDATRARIGDLPRGHGILGLIIQEDRTFRVRDLMTDPRRHGFPPHHPPMHTFLGVPVTVEGRSVGNLYLTEKQGGEEFSETDERVVETFARHAGIAIHNARLHAEVQRLAVVHERERIGQDLHDGVIQSLYAVGLSLEDVPELMVVDPGDAEARVERAIDSIHDTIRDLRSFIFGLRPETMDQDLETALLSLAEEFQRSTLLDVNVDVELDARDGPALAPELRVQLLHLAREALSNVARHAGASQVQVRARVDEGTVKLTVYDDGKGFDPSVAPGPGHQGLANMRARTEALGGTLDVDSAPGKGTSIGFRVPMEGRGRAAEATG